MPAVEAAAIEAYVEAHGIVPRRDAGLRCPYRLDDGCAVYPVRPSICRAYGHLRGMECPRGRGALVVDELPVARAIVAAGPPVTTTHTLAGVALGDDAAALMAALFPGTR